MLNPDLNTMMFMKYLDDLAEKTSVGFKAWSDMYASDRGYGGVVYDDREEIFDAETESVLYKLIDFCIVDELHHDIISYAQDSIVGVMSICVHHHTGINNEYDAWYIEFIFDDDTYLVDGDSVSIVVENGRWYFA